MTSEAKTARRIVCPRCSAPVTGEFKFCPSCAFRLQATSPVEEVQPPPAVRVGHSLLVVAALAVVGGLLWFGVAVFRDKSSTTAPAPSEALRRPLTLKDVPNELVKLTAGVAWFRGHPIPEAVGPTAFMKYEVTRGQYAEFLRDVEQHPEHVPGFLKELWTDPLNSAYIRGRVNSWWELAGAHLAALADRPVELPDYLLQHPLTNQAGILLLVPPSWTSITRWDEITWKIPEDSTVRVPENLPVAEVSWYDAWTFASWASDRLGVPLVLPTGEEWLRAGQSGIGENEWPWGKEPFSFACNSLNFWSPDDPGKDPAPADLGRPLPVDYTYHDAPGTTRDGLFSMSGNVAEWTDADRDSTTAQLFGGSFRRGLSDCGVTVSSSQAVLKELRRADWGFRLILRR